MKLLSDELTYLIRRKDTLKHRETPKPLKQFFITLLHQDTIAGTDQEQRICYHFLRLCFREDRKI